MTALREYQRLESPGLWREAPESQRREVIVAFGDATLVLSDSRSARALAHWSLPAVVRLNPGGMPALYAPGPEAGETLEIEDETMVSALEKVHVLIEARRPHPGRLRSWLLGGALAAVLALGLFWMPDALVTHTASVVPFAKRQEIGRMVLADVARLAGSPCAAPQGARALERLRARLMGGNPGQIVVLRAGLAGAAHVPGQIVLLGRPLIEEHDTAEVAAGHVLAELQRAEASDPLLRLLHWAGFVPTFRLLTTGDLPPDAVAGYAETLLTADPAPAAPEALIARFAAAGVRSGPYAYALDPSGETVLALIEADPFAATPPPAPALSDGDWVALQGICGE